MDVYEYFLRKIGFKICHVSELQNLNSFKSIDLEDYSWDIVELDDQIYVCYGFTEKSMACKCVYDRLTSRSYYFNIFYPNYSYSEKFILTIKNLIQQLVEFPEKMTSKEEVDLLLTLHGMNKGV